MLRVPRGFSPLVAFPALWLLGVLLGQIHVLDIQENWSARAWTVMLLVPVVFVLAVLATQRLAGRQLRRVQAPRAFEMPPPSGRLRIALVVTFGLGSLEAAHQFISGGTIPLLSSSIDAARTGLPQGPTYLLINLLTVAAIVAFTAPRRLGRAAWFEVAIGVLSLSVLTLLGSRGALVLPVVVSFALRWILHGRPATTWLVLGAIVLAAAASALFYARAAQPPTDNFDRELFGTVVPDTPKPLVPLLPLHFALAMNFDVLAHVVDEFPARTPYGHGRYDAVALDRVVPDTQRLTEVTARITPPWVVATFAGPLYADGGLVVVLIGTVVIAVLVAAAHQLAMRTGRFCWLLLYGYFGYLAVFGVYDNFWTQYIDWLFCAPALVAVGWWVTRGGAEAARPAVRSSLEARIPRPARAAALVACAVALGFVVIGASERGVDAVAAQPAPEATSSGLYPLDAGLIRLRPADVVATDSDLPDALSVIYVLRPLHRRVSVTELSYTGGNRLARAATTLSLPTRPGTAYDAGTFRGKPSVFAMVAVRGLISVAAAPLDGTPPQSLGAASLPPLSLTARRETFIAHWSGPQEDLFVLDRETVLGRSTLRIFSGESRFRRRLLTARPPLLPTPLDQATTDVAAVTGKRPDLVLVRRGAAGQNVEVHVLSGESRFGRFVAEQSTPALGGQPFPEVRYAIGTAQRIPSLLEIDARDPDLRIGIGELAFAPARPKP